MLRILFGSACVLSLLLCGGAIALTTHSHRAWHNLVWRIDAAAETDGAHSSLGSIWREYRVCGKVPGFRAGRPVSFGDAPEGGKGGLDAWCVKHEYVSLELADGSVRYRRYPHTLAPFT